MTDRQTCPSCGAAASGRFCSDCGTALAGASCGTCATPLTPGAHFCHRCGTPSGAGATAKGFAPMIPWAFAGIALLALVALVVGQRLGSRNDAPLPAAQDASADAPAGAMPRAPDISRMSPAERAQRLYDRIMRESSAGNTETVRTFLPMAVAAYETLGDLTPDQRYDLGRIGIAAGDTTLARAQADTILGGKPNHLLGLILGAQAARLEKLDDKARALDARLVANLAKEQAANLPEYAQHAAEIQGAVSAIGPARK